MSNPNLPTDPKGRKEMPMARGLLDYFPDACAAVANVSFVGNEQHNPGEPMHWARGKSNDHADCIVRHLIERGRTDIDGLSHSAKMAWRALALLQIEIEHENVLPGGDAGLLRERAVEAGIFPQDPVDEFPNPTVRQQFNEPKESVRPYRRPRCYIAGPMRGYPKLNFPAFDAARDLAIREGWNPISPADLDRDNDIHEDSEAGTGLKANREFAQRDCKAILSLRAEDGDALALLPGWTASTGARAEFFLASWVGLLIVDATTMKPFTLDQQKGLWDNAGGKGLGELKSAALRTIGGGH